MNIGSRIKHIRSRLKLTQEKFAQMLNTNRGTMGDWEKWRTRPTAETLIKIAELGGKSMDWLMTGKERDYQYDEITDKIAREVSDMTKDQKLDVLRYVEKEKMVADLLEKQKKK